MLLLLIIPLFLKADCDFITYTEIFTHLGPDGGDPEYVFAEFIEDWSLFSVSQKFTAGTKEFFEPIIYFCNCQYQFDCDKIYNDKEYEIKLFRNRFNRKKSKPRPYIQNPNPQTIIVDINGTGDYTTIQEGINNAVDGDIILVYPGTYVENIDYSGKSITVASKYYTTGNESYINNTIIDGNNNGSCVVIKDGGDEATIYGFTIQHGSGYDTGNYTYGGGIYIGYGDDIIDIFNILNCKIHDNEADNGGGIMVFDCLELNIIGTKIIHNFAYIAGGGFDKGDDNVIVNFSSQDRCDIYMNYSPLGSDIYNHGGTTVVYVDTFTVQEPDIFYAYAFEGSITFDMLNHKIEQINNDIYVSPDGNNANSGLSYNVAFLNIYHALIMVKSDSTHPNTIYVDEGTYSPSLTGEFFALSGKEYISITGAGKEVTILDAEQTCNLFMIHNISNFTLEDMSLQHGYETTIGGVSIRHYSNPILRNINLFDNNISSDLITTHLHCTQYCNPVCENVVISSSYQQVNERAIYCGGNSNPVFINCIIENNRTNPATGHFGAGSLDNTPLFIGCLITNNYGDINSGFNINWTFDQLFFINCTIVDNKDCSEGTIRLVDDSHVSLINTILRNDPETEIWFHPQHDPNSVSLEYCNIDGGIDAINTNNNGTVYWGDGNIDEDPLFVGGDPFSYELTKYSPCIDAGTPDTTGLHLPAKDLAGKPRIFNGRIDIGAYECQDTVSVDEPDTSFVNKLYLFQNTPNPFTNETEILFITADYERVEDYTLSIYNTRGQLIRRFDGTTHDFWVKTKIVWDGADEQGRQVAPGAYLYKLEYNGHAVVRKMVKLR